MIWSLDGMQTDLDVLGSKGSYKLLDFFADAALLGFLENAACQRVTFEGVVYPWPSRKSGYARLPVSINPSESQPHPVVVACTSGTPSIVQVAVRYRRRARVLTRSSTSTSNAAATFTSQPSVGDRSPAMIAQ